MDVHSRSSRAGAAAAVTALLLCTSLGAADAASSARATATRAVTSGGWGAVATTSSTAPFATGTLSLPLLNTAGNNGNPVYSPRFFTIGNTGTLSITGAVYTATASPAGATFKVEACSVTWNEAAGTCAGTLSTVLDTPATKLVSSIVPTAPGSGIRLRASVSGSIPKNTTPTLTFDVEVARNQTRTATVTGS